MRVLGHPDIHLPGDAAVRNGWARLTQGSVTDSPATLDAAMARVRPWRSYATLHLWRNAVPSTTATETADDAA